MELTRSRKYEESTEETTKETSSNDQLVEIKPIEDTPFTAVKAGDKWFLALGKYRLTEPLESEEACIESTQDASWGRIMQVIQIMIETNNTPKPN